MFNAFTSTRRLARVAAIGLAFAGASAVASQAQAQDALTVVRDATTGELRAPTALEAAALQQQAQAKASVSRVAKQPTLQKYHPNGARGVRLTDEFTSSVVAVRNADGSIGKQCVEGVAAEHAAHAHAAAAPVVKSALQPVTE